MDANNPIDRGNHDGNLDHVRRKNEVGRGAYVLDAFLPEHYLELTRRTS
jgi:hypothetical protein